ncbi:MAG TPA: hypothetical protein DDX06_10720 [Curvibacter sp.]|nr:hypothetical protein [Curvibacter sp.]
MKIDVIVRTLLICGLGWFQSAGAGLNEAKTNFTKIYDIPPTVTFEESPFDGIYLLRNGSGAVNLIDEAVTINGYGMGWRVRDDIKATNFKGLSAPEAKALQQVLRKNLKSNWLVKSDKAGGSKSVIVISAPNCGYCQELEKDLRKHGAALGATVYIVPTLLGQGADRFTNAVLCGPNPDAVWKQSLSQRGNFPQSNQECQKSRWAEMVFEHTFERVNANSRRISTPAIIRADGSVVFGWSPNATLAETRQRLGL